jgi:L-aminopeptidase/D-esterase-like protein
MNAVFALLLLAGSGLTRVPGIKVGHFTLGERPTGCTVILTEAGAVAGADVRGGAPGTREIDLLSPVNTVEKVHAIVLSGGSAFGLDAASGAVRYLEEKGIGFDVESRRCRSFPLPSSSISESAGDPSVRPRLRLRAAKAASDGPVRGKRRSGRRCDGGKDGGRSAR